mmetsp:Transcript_37838/g.96749  ORF Transcript_37838/g.96749 Transcript_37838/m.96749 type:complete len:242 (-) Transcript_37838:85-810(-)
MLEQTSRISWECSTESLMVHLVSAMPRITASMCAASSGVNALRCSSVRCLTSDSGAEMCDSRTGVFSAAWCADAFASWRIFSCSPSLCCSMSARCCSQALRFSGLHRRQGQCSMGALRFVRTMCSNSSSSMVPLLSVSNCSNRSWSSEVVGRFPISASALSSSSGCRVPSPLTSKELKHALILDDSWSAGIAAKYDVSSELPCSSELDAVRMTSTECVFISAMSALALAISSIMRGDHGLL